MTQTTQVAPHAHPVDLIIAITGSEQVKVKGFGAEQMPNSWVRPGVRFVGVEETTAGAIQSLVAQGKRAKQIRIGLAAGLLITGIALGNLFSVTKAKISPAITPLSTAIQWSPKAVTSEGLWIDTYSVAQSARGSIQEPTTSLIRIGAVLPNGETLKSTLVDMRTYTTNNATSMLNASSQPMAATAPVNTSN